MPEPWAGLLHKIARKNHRAITTELKLMLLLYAESQGVLPPEAKDPDNEDWAIT